MPAMHYRLRWPDASESTCYSPSLVIKDYFETGASYELPPLGWRFVQKSTVNLFYDHILYDYKDFRDVREGGTPGTEPAYSYDAGVIRLFFSGWF